MHDDLFELGLAKRRQVLGAEYVDRAMESADDFNRDFQRFMTEYCWGGVWGGAALDDRQRSLNNLSILATLGRMEEFELHLRGALRNGCTLGELRETLVQVAVYAGVPAGVAAFRAAGKVLAEEGVDTSQGSEGASR
jgi:4-carboxymuconolactone decarboxylase